MEYIKQSIFTIKEPTVLSFGKFDGLHRGDRKSTRLNSSHNQ